MAPTTSLRLLHIAAVLVMMASTGAVPEDTVFRFDQLPPTFGDLSRRECMPVGFDTSPIMDIADQCSAKVQSGDVPVECDGVPVMALFYNCFANSIGDFITVDGVKVYNVMAQANRMTSKDKAWNRAHTTRMFRCHRNIPTSLTPQQQAVAMYLCLKFSLFVDCDRQLDRRGAPDRSVWARRERFLELGAQMRPESMLTGAINGTTRAECNKQLNTGRDVAQRYASKVSALVCLLQDFVDDAGRLETDRLLTEIEQGKPGGKFADGLLALRAACGPSAPGYENATAEEFVSCWIDQGSQVNIGYEANLVASAMPESCTISL